MFFMNPEFTIFSTKFYVSSFTGLQGVFFCHNKQLYWQFFYLNRKFLSCKKSKQRKFRGKIRRFRNHEKMWWAWPWKWSGYLWSRVMFASCKGNLFLESSILKILLKFALPLQKLSYFCLTCYLPSFRRYFQLLSTHFKQNSVLQ